MKISLSGDDQLNTGAKGVAQLNYDYTLLKWALRDTIVQGFLSGFTNTKDKYPNIPDMYECIQCILKLALMLTNKDIA